MLMLFAQRDMTLRIQLLKYYDFSVGETCDDEFFAQKVELCVYKGRVDF